MTIDELRGIVSHIAASQTGCAMIQAPNSAARSLAGAVAIQGPDDGATGECERLDLGDETNVDVAEGPKGRCRPLQP